MTLARSHLLRSLPYLVVRNSWLAQQILLFHYVHSVLRHLLLTWNGAWCWDMVFSSACDNATRAIVLLLEWDFLRLGYRFVVFSHICCHWLVVFEDDILILLLCWWCLSTSETWLDGTNIGILLIGQVVHEDGVIGQLNAWRWCMSIIVRASRRRGSNHVQIRVNHILVLSIKRSVILVFRLIHPVMWSRSRYWLDILIALGRQPLRRLHILIHDALELVTAVDFGAWCLDLIQALVAVLTWISNLLTLLMILFGGNIRRSCWFLLFGVNIAFCYRGHDVSKVDFLCLDALSLVEGTWSSHELVDIVHFLRCASNVIFR